MHMTVAALISILLAHSDEGNRDIDGARMCIHVCGVSRSAPSTPGARGLLLLAFTGLRSHGSEEVELQQGDQMVWHMQMPRIRHAEGCGRWGRTRW